MNELDETNTETVAPTDAPDNDPSEPSAASDDTGTTDAEARSSSSAPAGRPSSSWIAVAAVFALLITSFVAWRALSGRENRQTNSILLGAPANVSGYDYERPSSTIWLSISGPEASSVNGDRFTAGCANEVLATPNAVRPACVPTNPDFDSRGHLYAVRVLKPESQRPLIIGAIDPQLSSGSSPTLQGCRTTGVSSSTSICPGDIAGDEPGMTTTFIVRAPDSTPDNPTDNPAICASTFTNETPDLPRRSSDQWVRLCTIPANRVLQGDYIVQVRTNADLSAPRTSKTADLDPATGAGSLERAEPTAKGDGQNHFGLRGEWEGGPDEGRSAGILVDALNHVAVFMNQTTPRVSMQLTNLGTSAAGQTLRVQVFDLGDAPAPTTGPPSSSSTSTRGGIDVRFVPPMDSTVDGAPLREFPGCRFVFGPAPNDVESFTSRCAVEGETPDRFNGKTVTVDIPIPPGYSCERSLATCWMSVQISYRGSPSDTSSWSAELVPNGASTPATANQPR